MLIIIETVIIISYMTNSMLGMTLMIALLAGIILFGNKRNNIYQSFELMIIALPMAYIGITGPSMHQLFSWYNLFLIVFVIRITRYYSLKIPFTKTALYSVLLVLFCLLVNLIWTNDLFGEMAEIAQVFVMMLPMTIVHITRNSFKLSDQDIYQLICNYVDVCVSTAISMIAQYYLFNIAHIQVGLFQHSGADRVQFLALFRGASILPIFMGVGIVFLLIECFEKKVSIERIIKIIIIFVASILNTSRTGLFSFMIVLFLICIKYFIKSPSFKGVFITGLGFAGSYYAINYITSLRNRLASFLDTNGRTDTWDNGIRIWTASLKNIVFGEGFAGPRWEGMVKPHNLIIQTLSQCGIIVTIIVLLMLLRYLVDNRKSPYIYIPLFIILAGMLVTDFYANAFTTVIFMLIDLYDSRQAFANQESLIEN